MKQIIINFESDKDYDIFMNNIVEQGLKEDKINFDKETNTMLIKEDSLIN